MKKRILAVFLCAAMFLTACSAENGNEITTAEKTTATTASTTAAGSDGTTAPTESSEKTTAKATDAPVTEKQPSNGLEVSIKIVNTWADGEKFCAQLDGEITNNSAADIGSWEIVVASVSGVEILQNWNGTFSASGSDIIVKNADYNGTVAKGGSTTFGFIIQGNTDITATVTSVNGSEASVPAGTAAPNNNSTVSGTTQELVDYTPLSSQGLVSEHGTLSVKGTQLVDKNGNPFQLLGMSTHGIQWFPSFVNKDSFRTIRDDWNCNVIRLAMYTGNSEGYNDSTKTEIEALTIKGIEIAIELDMYVIVDWHVLADGNPKVMKTDALRFFNYVSEKYKDCPNIIYEICNEPNGNVSWDNDIKPYAEEVIDVIRANDPNGIVIVGTPTWSQDIDKAANNPLDYDNVMYALHFYAATHTDFLRQRLTDCYSKGLAVFVSEFGLCDASGAGNNDFTQTEKWLRLLDSYGISYINWALADKQETCCALKPGASPTGGWTDSSINDGAKWFRDWLVAKR